MKSTNRAERRRLERCINRLIVRIEDPAARQEMIRLAQKPPAKLTQTGKLTGNKTFALCVTPDGIRYGERDVDGACDLEAYGPNGEFMFGWGGDNLDLLEEVSR